MNIAPAPEDFPLMGKVTDKNTALPIADLELTVVELAETQITDTDGNYIYGLLPDGNYNVQFTKMGYMVQTLPVTITAGKVMTLDVVLEDAPVP